MDQPVDALQMEWRGITIDVLITLNFLNTGYHHIELRADQPLPVTQTGYRSHFVPLDQFEGFDSLEQLVLQWLDHAAESKEWIKSEEDRRQLKLF